MFDSLVGPLLLIVIVVALVLLGDEWLWRWRVKSDLRDLERALGRDEVRHHRSDV